MFLLALAQNLENLLSQINSSTWGNLAVGTGANFMGKAGNYIFLHAHNMGGMPDNAMAVNVFAQTVIDNMEELGYRLDTDYLIGWDGNGQSKTRGQLMVTLEILTDTPTGAWGGWEFPMGEFPPENGLKIG